MDVISTWIICLQSNRVKRIAIWAKWEFIFFPNHAGSASDCRVISCDATTLVAIQHKAEAVEKNTGSLFVTHCLNRSGKNLV